MNDTLITETDQTDRAYEVGGALIEAILQAVEYNDRAAFDRLLEPLHAADIADILEQIGSRERAAFVTFWGPDFDGEVLAEMDEALSSEILSRLPDSVMGGAFRDMETDDVVDLVEELEHKDQTRILDALDASDRIAVENALQYQATLQFIDGRIKTLRKAIRGD